VTVHTDPHASLIPSFAILGCLLHVSALLRQGVCPMTLAWMWQGPGVQVLHKVRICLVDGPRIFMVAPDLKLVLVPGVNTAPLLGLRRLWMSCCLGVSAMPCC
jgi:hypothetical protein